MNPRIYLRNRQRVRPVHLPLLRQITRALLELRRAEQDSEIGVCLVAGPEMARLNENFLDHAGSTDVITFDYAEPAQATSPSEPGRADLPARPTRVKGARCGQSSERSLHGEIFICVDDAVKQARQFRTSWPEEVVRYLVHGVLHLEGFDDLTPAARRVMKRAENNLVQELARRFPLRGLAQKPKVKLTWTSAARD